MATTLLLDLVPTVRRSTSFFDDLTDEAIVGIILDSLDTLQAEGINFVMDPMGTTPLTAGFITPALTPLLRSIIRLQAKVLALKSIPVSDLAITGMRVAINADQILQDQDDLQELINAYTMDIDPRAFVMNEYDVLGSPAIQLRTLKSVLFPSNPPII